MDKTFNFTARYKIPLLLLILIGISGMAAALFFTHDHGTRFWSNFHMNTVYIIMISLAGMVFLALHALGTSGWQTSIQRIPEAMMMFLPAGLVLMLIVLAGMWFNLHHIFHWVHPDPGDEVLQLKKAYLNVPFFSIRTFIYLGGWIFFARWWRINSLRQDRDADLKYFKRTNTVAGIFMVFFAITSSMAAWDWLMSIDPDWFSTLFGWYVFAGLLVSGTAMIILIVIVLRAFGYLPHVNREHLHDLGKYLFAFSILWTYLWFSQYMLIWYGNIPEETVYFVERLKEYNLLFFLNITVNFSVPLLGLMTRNSKRIPVILALIAIAVFIGHWIDFYLMVMPGSAGANAKIGFIEIAMTLGFLGFFLWIVFRALAKANLVPSNHPFYKESLEYHTQY